MTMAQNVQKILGGNRVSLPQEWLELTNAKEGDVVIVEFDAKMVRIRLGEVRPK